MTEAEINDAEYEAKRQAYFDQQQFDNKFILDTPEIGTSYSERLDWLAKNQTKYETDDEFMKLGARDYYLNHEQQIQYIIMREQQEYEKATELYSMIKNDPDYKKAYEVNDKTEMNQAIGNVVWDHNEDYGDIMQPKRLYSVIAQ